MAKKGTVRELLDSAQEHSYNISDYIDRERRVVKRRVRRNNGYAIAAMIYASCIFMVMLMGALVYWIDNSWTYVGEMQNGVGQVAKKLYSLTSASTSVTGNQIAKYYGTMMAVNVCAFFGCLAFRRGVNNRTKKGWVLAYIFSTLGVLALYWFWCVKNVCGGDMGLWIENLTTSYSGGAFIGVVLYALIAFISLLVVHAAGVGEGKIDRIRRREEGKIHAGVCLMYICSAILSWIGILVMIIVLIARKIRMVKTKDDDDYDLAPYDEWEEEAAQYE